MIETPPLQPTPRPFYRNPWLLVGIVALLGVSFFAGYLSVRIHHRHESLQQAVGSIFIPEPQTYFHKDRIRVLVLGIDYNYNDKDEAYSTGARSDTIMALSLNFPTATAPNGSVSILSVPRDTGVTYPGGREDKINTAYATGGVKESEKIVAAFLGLPAFDRYVVLRINALKQVIDAIGGIDVVADETMNYDDTWGHLHIHFIGGKLYHMDGEQAVSYSRFRHDACSDPCRIKRQQQIVRIVLAKLKSDRVNDLIHIRDLLKVVNDNVVTNFRLPEEESIALAMSGLDPNTVRTAQVPYVDDIQLACCGDTLVPDETAKRALVKRLFVDAVPRTVPVDVAALAEIPPSTIRVDVLNGTAKSGLATTVANLLRKDGFVVGSVGNADAADRAATELDVHSTNQPLAGDRVRLALSRPALKIVADESASATTSDVTLVLGKDWLRPSQREASAVKLK